MALLVANRFYARFGVATAALLLPVVYLGGFAVWVVRLTFPTAAAVTVVQQITQRGLSNAAWSAFYNVVPASRRAQVLAFMDGVPGQLGTVLSGVLLLTAGRILAPEQVAWLGLGTAALAVVVVVAIRRRYADALVRTLRSGIGEQLLEGGPGPGDMIAVPEVRAALAASMDAPQPAIRCLAASMLARSDAPDARAGAGGRPRRRRSDGGRRGRRGHPARRDGRRRPGRHARAGRPGRTPPGRASWPATRSRAWSGCARRTGWAACPDAGLRAAMLADPSPAVRSMGLLMLGDDPDPAATAVLRPRPSATRCR